MDGLRDPRHEDEIRHHIEERAARLIEDGVDPAEARRRAERAFGDPDAVRRELARIDLGRARPMARFRDRVVSDVSFAFRQLRRNPGYAATAIVTLALGIGASTAIFGLVKAVVLDPLPYPESDRIVSVQEVTPDGLLFSVSEANYRDFREGVGTLEHLTAISRSDLATHVDGRPLNVIARRVTADFFPLFGGTPGLGRLLREDETGLRTRAVAVIGHAFWRDVLGGTPDAIGRTIPLDGAPYEVVGVMPPGWNPTDDADVWIPLAYDDPDRGNHDLAVRGRIARGVTPEAAGEDLRRVAADLGRLYPETNGGWSARLRPLREVVVGDARIRGGWVLLTAVGLLLALACASVSNLLLARATTRGREMGLRATLGAGRRRLVQQLLTESIVLGGLGAVAGLLLASVLLPALVALTPADTPRIEAVAIDPLVAAFAALVGLATGVVFGLVPVAHVAGGRLGALTRSGGREVGRGSDRTRAALVAAQVGASLSLLFGAGVLGSGFARLSRQDVGLDLEHTTVVRLMLSGDRYAAVERGVALRSLEERLVAIPGVAAVGTSNILPFSGGNTAINLRVEGRETTPESAPFVRWRAVSPTWFSAAGLGLLHGRGLEEADGSEDAEEVVVLTRALAARLFEDPATAVGERMAFGWNGENYRRIVGVVEDVEDVGADLQVPSVLFFPHGGFFPWAILSVRSAAGATAPDAGEIRQAIWEIDPALPVPLVERLSDRFGRSVASPRFNVVVVAALGSVALALALTALYGLVLFALRRRTREIGVRLALGARPSVVVRLMLRHGLVVTVAGIAVGVALSLALGRGLEALAYATDGSNALVLGAAAAVVAAASLLATWLPASLATTVDPRNALSAE